MRCILTRPAQQFVTPLSRRSLSGDKVYTDLFSLTDEAEMGHIELSRDADLLVVAPATADLLAKMAHGLANDLASTALLATDKPVLVAPAMNVRMWQHPATQRNLATLRGDGVALRRPRRGRDGLRRVRAGPDGRAGGDRRRRRSAMLGRAARPARSRAAAMLVTVGPDARAHRSRALHRQPLLRQAGPRHRRGAARRWAPR